MSDDKSKKKKISPEDVVALSKLMIGVAAFLKWLATQEDTEDEDLVRKAKAVKGKAVSLLRVFKPMNNEVVEHLSWLTTQPAGQRLKPLLKRARMGGAPETKAVRQSNFIGQAFKVASIRQEMRQTLFGSGKATVQARAMGNLVSSTPVEIVLGLVTLAPVGKGRPMTATKAWLKSVAKLMEVDGSGEERIADIGETQSLATEIKEIDRRLKVLPPSGDEARDLQADRSTKMDTLVKIAQSSGDEQAALGAASSIIYAQTSFATDIGKQLNMTEEQEAAMMVTGKSLIAAGAGSGKTRVLAGKVIDIINREGGKSSQIIATSFSKKSAAELKERVLKYGASGILDGGSNGFGTTHSIGFKLLKKLNPKYKKAGIIEGNYLVKMAMKQVEMEVNNIPDEPPSVGMFDGLLATENKTVKLEQDDITSGGAASEDDITLRKVVDSLYGLAAWGADKDYGWAYAEEKALKPLYDRIDSLTLDSLSPAEKSTITKMVSKDRYKRSLGRGGLDQNYKVAAGNRTYQKGVNYWKEPANEWFNINGVFMDEAGNAIGPKRVALAIGKYRSNLVTHSEAASEARAEAEALGLAEPTDGGSPKDVPQTYKRLMSACYGAYMWLKENESGAVGNVDFTDMQLECIKELIKNPKGLQAVQQQYKWILVDEAQDLNKLQHLLFGLIAGAVDPATQKEKTDGSMTAKTFTFIGDDKQAIYEFRGATPEEYSEKSDMRGGSFDTKLISSNFRSGKEIVDAANRLIAHNEKQIPMVCSTDPKRGEGEINYQNVATHSEGASVCAEEIKGLIESEGWTEPDIPSFGVAVRTNAEALAFGLEMIKRRIPFRSKMNFFTDPTTKALSGWLTLAEADADDKKKINDVVLKAYSSPKFYLDRKFNTELQRKARGQNYLEWLKNGGWDQIYEGRSAWRNKNVKKYTDTLARVQSFEGSPGEIFEAILQIKGVGFKGKPPESIIESLINRTKGDPDTMDLLFENATEGKVSEDDIKELALAPITPLLELLQEFEDIGPAMDYVRELQDASKSKSYKDDPDDEDKAKPAVTIDTCHGWKGLEARHMWVPMAGGVFPHAKSEGDPEAMESERRLAYVALTRGRDSVNVLCPAKSHTGQAAGTSRFVREACIKSRDAEEWQTDVNRTASEIADREAELWNYVRLAHENETLTEAEWAEYELSQSYGDLVLEGVR